MLASARRACYDGSMDKQNEDVKLTWGGSLLAVGTIGFLIFGFVVGVRGCQEREAAYEEHLAELQAEYEESAASLRPGEYVVVDKGARRAWKDLEALRLYESMPINAAEAELDAALARRGVMKLPEGKAVMVRKVSSTPDDNGFYYVQVRWAGADWWISETQLEF